MTHIHFVCGPQGAGKTTYAKMLAQNEQATLFSIDQWMIQLFGPDLPKPMNLSWIMERVKRCERQIWTTAKQIGGRGGKVVLDLGFMKAASRAEFLALAHQSGLTPKLHYLTAPRAIRRERVLARNLKKGDTFSFEGVTPVIFDFMEREFEIPSEIELMDAECINTEQFSYRLNDYIL
jgi:predicted kinase